MLRRWKRALASLKGGRRRSVAEAEARERTIAESETKLAESETKLAESETKLAESETKLEIKQAELEIKQAELREFRTALAEALKLHFDAYKSLTVLNSGALVAFAVITNNLLSQQAQQGLLFAAYGFALISLIGSLLMMFVMGERVASVLAPERLPEADRLWGWRVRVVDGLATITFVAGLICFLAFLANNL